jgi:pyruvate formate lyase activating enzyme
MLMVEMSKCKLCGREGVSSALSVCVDCIREKLENLEDVHEKVRKNFLLPPKPPKTPNGIKCDLCSNGCIMGEGEKSFCGLRENVNGEMVSKVSSKTALVHTYLDPLPTNCCAAWFCPGSWERGYNLATFFYGCNFDCLSCQNSSHKYVDGAPRMGIEEFLRWAKPDQVRCICYFGGSPEPQLPFALRASEKILKEKKVRICWEWNGCGNPELVKKAGEISLKSGGIIKFDLKAFDRYLSIALSGAPNDRAFENFELIAERYGKEVITATTLLVPNYVDAKEVEGIARFIAAIDPDIPYSLLVFHPDFYMQDMPITPRRQVVQCYNVARRYLNRVNIGNRHLLI